MRFDEVEIEKAATYAAEDADITLRLWQHFKPEVAKEKLITIYETIERPLITVLTAMEANGIKVDTAQLSALSKDFAVRMQEYEREIHSLAGREFNVASPKQLGEILFDEMKLPGGKKSDKSGAYATSVGVLEDLAEQGHELPRKILEWRQLAKLKSTYTDSLAGQINPETGRIHTCFSMAIAATGRLSSTEPNLQNIPIRTEEGREIRKAFVAPKGYKLVSVDYSQIELRLMAAMANIPALKEAFEKGADIHALTASEVLDIPLDKVTSDQRRSAKAINFGIIYGISGWGLAKQLGISPGEANQIISRYFSRFPEIRDFMEDAKEEARKQGHVLTMLGRKCMMDGINDKNGARRAAVERQAINAPLQGTAADVMKRAMIAVDRWLQESKLDARLILQVHDELVLEAREDIAQQVADKVSELMEQAGREMKISVPLTAEADIADAWE